MTELFLLDTNIILDLLNDDPVFADSSQAWIDHWSQTKVPAINQIVYAELAPLYSQSSELDKDLCRFEKLSLTYEAAFLASKAFLKYRKNGGVRTTVLPDFLIGAHAVHLNIPLMTRDQRRYLTYFPDIALCPPL